MAGHPSREKLYTPPPPPPAISAERHFPGEGGGGVYFEAPRGRNFIRPPPFIHPPPLGGYLEGWGGWGCTKIGPVTFSSVFPFFSRDFRGSVGTKNPCFFFLGQKNCRPKVPRIFKIFVPNFAPNFSRIFRASFRGKRRPEKIHQKSPPFFNAKFPGKHEKKYSQNVSGEQAKQFFGGFPCLLPKKSTRKGRTG